MSIQMSDVRCQMFLITFRLALWILKYLPSTQNTFQIFIKCVYFKSFTNLFQMSCKLFFLCKYQTYTHSLSRCLPTDKHLHCYQPLLFWGTSRNTKGEWDYKIIKIFGHCIYAKYYLTDPSRSCQIFPDLHIFH